MVAAYKKGKLKTASPEIKGVSKGISLGSAEDFARTSRRGLAQSMTKK